MISEYERKEATPGSDKLPRLAKALSLSQAELTKWLDSTVQDHTPAPRPDPPQSESEVEYPFMIRGPGAGPARVVTDEAEHPVRLPKSLLLRWIGRAPEEAYWTVVEGDSMEPWLPDGAPILVERCDSFQSGGRYVLWVDDDHGNVVKRVERLGGGALLLISDNPAHPTRTLRHVEGDLYEDPQHGLTLQLRVQGRVILPPDTPHAILRTFATLGQRPSDNGH